MQQHHKLNSPPRRSCSLLNPAESAPSVFFHEKYVFGVRYFSLSLNLIVGDIASDLYGPQFWDDNFQFSFSVVVSCKSNKQLGYF